jgi:hypothetical protein
MPQRRLKRKRHLNRPFKRWLKRKLKRCEAEAGREEAEAGREDESRQEDGHLQDIASKKIVVAKDHREARRHLHPKEPKASCASWKKKGRKKKKKGLNWWLKRGLQLGGGTCVRRDAMCASMAVRSMLAHASASPEPAGKVTAFACLSVCVCCAFVVLSSTEISEERVRKRRQW